MLLSAGVWFIMNMFCFIGLFDYQHFSLSLPAALDQLVTGPLPPRLPLRPCPTCPTRPPRWHLQHMLGHPPLHVPSPSLHPLQQPQGAARFESGQSGSHHPGRATGHCVGLSFITGRPFSLGVHMPWSSAACSGTSPVHCRYKWDIHRIHNAEIHISNQKETSVKECLSLFHLAGPNNVSLFKADGEPSEVNSKLVLYYTPQVIIFPVIHLIHKHTHTHTSDSWSRRLSRLPWDHWLLTDPLNRAVGLVGGNWEWMGKFTWEEAMPPSWYDWIWLVMIGCDWFMR